MSRQIQIRRGTAAEHENFTGAIGEVTMDTTNKTLRVHDGVIAGGNELLSANKYNSSFTNCITTLPQNIDLELSSGVLTLKSGSKICVPNGKSSASQNSNLGSRSWNYIFYNGVKYMIIGNTGYISTSDDGTNWAVATKNTQLGSKAWMVINYNGTKYVALGSTGGLSTSTDGITWNTALIQQNLGNRAWSILIYDGIKFIAIGMTGYISTSPDGTAWAVATENTTLGNHNWWDAAYDGTKYVALGADGYISTSTDGLIWTTPVQVANLGANSWHRIAYDGTKFVALGGTGYISTSTDGTTWTTAVQNTSLGNRTWTGLIYDGEKFIATGNSGYIAYSLDGVTWGGLMFKDVTLNADKTVDTQSTTGKTMIFYDNTTATVRGDIVVNNCLSGTTASANSIFYNTSNNIIDFYNGSVVASGKKYSFPLAIVTVSGGTVTSIDQVFNGIGYIGSTIFSFPEISGLIPNGKNENGGLNSTAFKTTDICTVNFPSTYTHDSVPVGINSLSITYDLDYNYNNAMNKNTGDYVIIGSADVSSGQITNFQIKTVFHIADYSEFLFLKDKVDNIGNTLGDLDSSVDSLEDSVGDIEDVIDSMGNISDIVSTQSSSKTQSGYFKFNNGLIIQWMNGLEPTEQNQEFQFPTAFTSATSYGVNVTYTGHNESMYPVSIHEQTATSIKIHRYTGISGFTFNVIAIGY